MKENKTKPFDEFFEYVFISFEILIRKKNTGIHVKRKYVNELCANNYLWKDLYCGYFLVYCLKGGKIKKK